MSATDMEGGRMGVAVVRDITKRKADEELARQALHDNLTGLPNRGFLLNRIGETTLEAERSGEPFALDSRPRRIQADQRPARPPSRRSGVTRSRAAPTRTSAQGRRGRSSGWGRIRDPACAPDGRQDRLRCCGSDRSLHTPASAGRGDVLQALQASGSLSTRSMAIPQAICSTAPTRPCIQPSGTGSASPSTIPTPRRR